MPGDGAILDPFGAAEERRWRQRIENELKALKQRPQTTPLGYKFDDQPARYTTAPAVVFATLDNLTMEVTVGSNRAIRVTQFVFARIFILGGTVTSYVLADDQDTIVYGGTTVGSSGDVMVNNYEGIWLPTEGRHRLTVIAAATTGDFETPPAYSAPDGKNYLFVEDVGLAP